ncbi:hypothetical protein [Enterococcus raffinosus]|uniref:Uncharacterized protein n=1 Tax=Enterococcus raffinosus TaxID=71452 RepID=A0AAW8TIG9_9ENTE|nr:hypothetical protein [Enterococcus raffinosus]MDT2525979.1 hypothetical protein [Enterococcus raffinosus]MDT2531813.1 hypothetical protein [Enterococcus raffinosus]MDT2546932.1 hypothetical protein [Enterococcus raffinosus]MDT2593255.1 hypothetical protein [Enterococcus raffinosus]
MKKKILEFLAAAYPIFLLVMATVFVFMDDWNRSLLFIMLYAVCLIDDRLRDIHRGIGILWYRMYLRNKKDGIE